LGKDEIKFTLSGKCAKFMILYPEVTLELTYSTGKKTLNASKNGWSNADPLTISLPDGLSGLQSYRLTGKFHSVIKPKGKLTGDLDKDFDVVTGYKIDSKWIVK
jgi:hypothetical protein